MSKLYIPTREGYELFTHRIHKNALTGILHGLFTPLAGVGGILIIHSLNLLIYRYGSKRLGIKEGYRPLDITKKILYFIIGFFASGYLSYSPGYGIATLVLYWYILSGLINRVNNVCNIHSDVKTILSNIGKGAIAIGISVGMMEFIGHWILEGKSSNTRLLANSIYHTPLYGVISISQPIVNMIVNGVDIINSFLISHIL